MGHREPRTIKFTVEKFAKQDRFQGRFPFYAAAGALILLLPLVIYTYDFGVVIYLVLAAPIICISLLVTAIVVAIRKNQLRSLSIFSMLAVYCGVSWVILRNSTTIHTHARWFLWSKGYKAEVLAQPVSANGEFRHLEWDGWGWAGGETNAYLVFDPNSSLSAAAKSHASGKFSDTLCGVSRVIRLEDDWYSVVFYTDFAWGQCN
jgi:hypothetical protein